LHAGASLQRNDCLNVGKTPLAPQCGCEWLWSRVGGFKVAPLIYYYFAAFPQFHTPYFAAMLQLGHFFVGVFSDLFSQIKQNRMPPYSIRFLNNLCQL
jgi:hypothetical protein